MKLFAAVDVGSYELGMKIFEMGGKSGIREIDYIRHRIDLGNDTFHTGMISYERMDELCEILKGFVKIMDSYKVDEYRAYGTSAIRETENTRIVLDQIRLRTGLDVKVLSNSEQRFLDYKSVALKGASFDNFIQKGTAFVDIGGGSTQISLFQNGRLASTVNLHLGILRIREKLTELEPKNTQYEELISEIINSELHTFKKLYLQGLDIENIIIIDDYISAIMQKITKSDKTDTVTAEQYIKVLDILKTKAPEQVAKELGIPAENSSLLIPSALLISHVIMATNAKYLWLPGVSLSDGIAYDYADRYKFIRSTHDFEQDILSSAENISLRYMGSRSISNTLVKVSVTIYDSMKKMHGLPKRNRLLLQLAARLRDVGKYVSMSSPAELSYSIIMGSEIIGISHIEREMVAMIVMNSYPKDIMYSDFSADDFDSDTYLTVVKLSAILRVATGLGRISKRNYSDIHAAVKDKELVVTVDTEDDMLLEKGLFSERTNTFEEVFGLHPVLKVRGGIR